MGNKFFHLKDVTSGVTEKELTILCRAVQYFQPNKILEIGTFHGRTTLNLAQFSKRNAIIYTLDISKASGKYLSEKENIPKNVRRKIIRVINNSKTIDYKQEKITDIDFIFIDGDHKALPVYIDSCKALKILNNKGVIFWHDAFISQRMDLRVLPALLTFEKNKKITVYYHVQDTSLACYMSEQQWEGFNEYISKK